jgi:hypothetical protein
MCLTSRILMFAAIDCKLNKRISIGCTVHKISQLNVWIENLIHHIGDFIPYLWEKLPKSDSNFVTRKNVSEWAGVLSNQSQTQNLSLMKRLFQCRERGYLVIARWRENKTKNDNYSFLNYELLNTVIKICIFFHNSRLGFIFCLAI